MCLDEERLECEYGIRDIVVDHLIESLVLMFKSILLIMKQGIQFIHRSGESTLVRPHTTGQHTIFETNRNLTLSFDPFSGSPLITLNHLTYTSDKAYTLYL